MVGIRVDTLGFPAPGNDDPLIWHHLYVLASDNVALGDGDVIDTALLATSWTESHCYIIH